MRAETLPLTGYADPLSGRPGERIGFHVSSAGGEPYQAKPVRIRCADSNPDGPGLLEEAIDLDLGGPFPGREQAFFPGSCAMVEGEDLLDNATDWFLSVLVAPFLLQHGKRQAIMALAGDGDAAFLALEISGEDRLSLMSGERELLHLDVPLRKRHWYRIVAWQDTSSGGCGLRVVSLQGGREKSAESTVPVDPPPACRRVMIAADWAGRPVRHFNGKIESPVIRRGAAEGQEQEAVIAAWDFSREMSSTRILDTGPSGFHGRLLNHPARAMTGASWDGSEMNWVHRPEHYAAIHFHEDDIVDFGWQADFHLTIPENLPSGAYAVRIESGDHLDWLPFYVLPPRGRPANRLCVLISTFTYAIYGNHARPDFTPEWVTQAREKGGYPWNPAEYPQYGLSTYNVHRDGSGICHASHKRPLLNMRPGYITFPNLECSGLRHYQADSHLLYWLEQQGIGYDIVTDRELHEEGVSVFDGYAAVCTGTHPEYHTPQTLDALVEWRCRGGNLLYLGGNGFYWRVALHPEDHGIIEIRRAEGGIRAWAAEPGEYYHAFDGGYGGLWRRNRRPPQVLAGVGFSAQGTFAGSWYRRTPLSFSDPDVAFIFQDIEDEILGDFGLCGGGAAGFELDRCDPELGSDPEVRVIASSGGHGDEFTLVPEERLTHITNWPGQPESDLIRADMVYQQQENGGKLFATGSITFCGSLLVNGGDNNISRLLANVMHDFLG
jgi:N,N-dimethylformamidase